jgi:hypothetical protein
MAMAIIKGMGYTDKQIAIAGDGVHNVQGVGNPDIHASIQPGETFLDVGSGSGMTHFWLGQQWATLICAGGH